jgi:TonB-linked SusC/RagA family outer membrane protein
MKLKSAWLLCTFLMLQCFLVEAFGQGPVTGKVTSRSGDALPGATVTVKGTTTATVTDANGNFTINASRGSVLLVTYQGMTDQELTVDDTGTLNFQLTERSGSLNEVVVVGYGTQRRRTLTTSISTVKADDLEGMPVMRVEQALQGRASGLTIAAASGQPGAGATVRVRGTTSINNSDPLVVVDGVPLDGGYDYLNPNDIESIDVLKDAASAAIYGARAANGVILVTTKKGSRSAIRVSYNAYYGTQAPARKLDLLNATEYATLRNEASVASGGPILFTNPQALGEGTDWQKAIFNNDARIQSHDVSLSGGSERSTFYASFGYFDQDGIVATEISNYRRFTVRFNSTHKIKSWLNFGNTLGYTRTKAQGVGNTNSEFGGPLSSAINLDPITPVIITDPSIANAPPYSNQPVVRDAIGNPYGISQYVGQEMTNPLAYINTRLGNYGAADNLVGNVYVEIEPIKGLKVRSNVGAKLAYYGGEAFNGIYFLNASTGRTNTEFFRENNNVVIWNVENTANYNRAFGSHNLGLLLGQSAQRNFARGLNGVYQNIPAKNFEEASMNFSLAAANRIAGGWESEYTLSSYFGRLNYNFKEKYLLQAILRADGSARFGSNNKYGYFPSVSAGWVASSEDFFPQGSSNPVSFLKIRGSYGVTGNDQIPNFAYVSTIGGGRNYTFGNDQLTIGNSPNAPANPDLRWEETTSSNIGLDATLFRNFTLTFDVWKKKTSGMLLAVVLPAYVGSTGNPLGNVADMENKGFDLELGYGRKLGGFDFSIRGNVSHLKNEVTWLGADKKFLEGAGFQASTYSIGRTQVGHAIGSFYGFQTQGIFQNTAEVNSYVNKQGGLIQPNARPGDFRYADLNDDGLIDAADRTFIGDPTPDWSYGFTANAAFMGFDVVLFGQGVAGNQIFQGLRRLDIPSANWSTKALGRWTGEGTSNTFPRLVAGDPNKNFSNPSSFYLEDGDYFRIKTLQVGYSLPGSVINRIGVQRLRVYLSGFNLVTFTNYTGYDPEIGGGSYGIDRGFYPQARSFQAGVNLTF